MEPPANETEILFPAKMVREVERKLAGTPVDFSRYVRALVEADLEARLLPHCTRARTRRDRGTR